MPLLDEVRAVCARLAPHGWADLLGRHGLDIVADELRTALAGELSGIDRDLPGFEDFAAEGRRGIEPGMPARSLLYHALASPNVVTGADGRELTDFPTPAELATVENYVFGVRPPSLPDLIVRAAEAELAVVVFAAEYRPSFQTPHQRHADLVFSRTGVARVGNAPPRYDGRRRGFLPAVDDDPHGIRVLPARYAPYLAMLRPGDLASFVPLRFRRATAAEPGDEQRMFWLPLHKLFGGPECLSGLDLTVALETTHVNEKIRRIHLALGDAASWRTPDIDRPPFVFTEGIAAMATDPQLDPGTVVPEPHATLVEAAVYQGEPLSFDVPAGQTLFSSLAIPPVDDRWRHGPEYVHARTLVRDDGTEVDLNTEPEVARIVRAGGYLARHYLDFSGDGWVAAVIPELAVALPRQRNAYSLVTAPDFFPSTDQRELTEWTAQRLPRHLRESIWERPPDPLSDDRLPPNLALTGSGFRPDDDTVTALVSMPLAPPIRLTRVQIARTERHSHLPDDAAGFFAPGWDVSVDLPDGATPHLAAYGLGSPFPEDSKLCAALSAFWPAVAPDAARTFAPMRGWPTVAPLTDEEIGITGDLPWDGVRGPVLVEVDGAEVVEYPSIDHADYVTNSLEGRFSLARTGRIQEHEYRGRVLAMARAYEALETIGARDGVPFRKSDWAVLSFRGMDPADGVAETAAGETGVRLTAPLHRFDVFLHGAQRRHPTDVTRVLVDVGLRIELLVDPLRVLARQQGGSWRRAA